MLKNRKGIQLNEAAGAVLTLVLIGILVIVGIYMFTSMIPTAPRVYQTVHNETGAYINSTGYVLGNYNSTACDFGNAVILVINNKSAGGVIGSGNYTLVNNTIYNATAENKPSVNVTYSYTWGGPVCQSSTSTITQFTAYPALIGLVGTIIFLGIVIGVLVGSFAFGRKSGP